MFTVAEKNTVNCLEGFSFLSLFVICFCFFHLKKIPDFPSEIVGCSWKSSVVFANPQQSSEISEITGIVAEERLSEV